MSPIPLEDFDVNVFACFRLKDNVFAGDEKSVEYARRLLNDCWQFGYSFAEYIAMLEQYLIAYGCTPEHIAEQLQRIKNLELYF